jgi:serpin B
MIQDLTSLKDNNISDKTNQIPDNQKIQNFLTNKNLILKRIFFKYKSIYLILITFLIIIFVFSIKVINNIKNRQELLPTPYMQITIQPTEVPLENINKVVLSHNYFAFNLLNKIANNNKNENILFSPISLSMVLDILYNGASENTKNEISQTMFYAEISEDEINQQNKFLNEVLNVGNNDIEIKLANSILARQGKDFNEKFMNINKDFYNIYINFADFSDNKTVDDINLWVKETTNNKIKGMLEPPIDNNTVMFLLNAFYFNALWKYEFDITKTTVDFFDLINGDRISVPFMFQERENFIYLENNQFQSIVLPYGKDSSYAMTVILPKIDINDLLQKLNGDYWNELQSQYAGRKGLLRMPGFRIEYEQMMNDVFIKLGIKEAFSNLTADFSRIRKENDLYISKIKHKTYIEVNEKGTEAAAASSIEIGLKTAIEINDQTPFDMVVNKPFLFLITENNTGSIIFIGQVFNPSG